MANLRRLRRRTLPILPTVLGLLFGAMLWFGSSYALAADRPLDLQQTIPTPLPTAPEPTAVPPTPIPPRPNDENNDQEQDNNAEENSAPAESQPEISAVPQITTTTLLSATVLAPRINVRQGPGPNFAVIGNLVADTQGTVLGTNASRTWLNLCCLPGTETTGWVSASLVAVEGTAEELAALPVVEPETSAETSVTAERSAPAAEATPAAAEEAAAGATPAAAEEAAAEIAPATLPTTGVNLGGATTLPVVVFLLALLAVGGFVSRRRS